MSANSTTKPFVTIRIGPQGASKIREIRLSRLQFELALVVIPTVFMWGIVSTAIILTGDPRYTWFSAKEKTPVNAVASESATTAAAPAQSIDAQSIAIEGSDDVVAGKNPTASVQTTWPRLSETSLTVGDLFKVNATTLGRLDGPFMMKLNIKNQTSNLESGHFWIHVKAETKAGEVVWYTVNPNVVVDDQGLAVGSEKGIRYSLRNTRSQELALYGPKVEIAKFTEFVVGFNRESGERLVARSMY